MTKLKVKVCQNGPDNWFATIDEPGRTIDTEGRYGVALHDFYVHPLGSTNESPKYYPTREALRGAIRQYNAMNTAFTLVGGLH